MKSKFTQDDSIEMLSNPIYTGMGPYPDIVGLELWLDTNVRMIAEEGSQTVIESILWQFKEVFPCFQIPDAAPYIHLAESAPETALRRLLADLNESLENPPGYCPYRDLQNARRTTTDEQAVESFLQIVTQVIERLLCRDETFSHNGTAEQ